MCIYLYVRQGWTKFTKTSSPPKILRVRRVTFRTGNPQTVGGAPFAVQNLSKQAAWLRESVQRSSSMNSWFDKMTVHTISSLRMLNVIHTLLYSICRSQWPRGLRRGSAAARLLGLRFRIPLGSWMSVSCNWYVLSGRGLIALTHSFLQLCQQLIQSYPSISVEVLKVFSFIRVFW